MALKAPLAPFVRRVASGQVSIHCTVWLRATRVKVYPSYRLRYGKVNSPTSAAREAIPPRTKGFAVLILILKQTTCYMTFFEIVLEFEGIELTRALPVHC